MGKPKHSNDRRGEQKGAQQHDEGQYGPKAFEAKRAEIADHSGSRGQSERAENDPRAADGSDAADHERRIANPEFEADGRHRLFENRKQHDEAERGSERNRRDIDIERHGHDPRSFQGHEKERGDVSIRSSGKGGGDA